MSKRLFPILAAFLFACGTSSAQNVYVVKGTDVVGVHAEADIDYITFNPTEDLQLQLTGHTPIGSAAYDSLYLVKDDIITAAYSTDDVDYLTFTLDPQLNYKAYSISCVSGSDYTVTCQRQAVPGQKVTAFVTVSLPQYRPAYLNANTTACVQEDNDGITWKYTFTMPERNATLSAATELDYHYIYPSASEGGYVTMLNCCFDWDAAPEDRVFESILYNKVKFWWGPELGYDATLTVKGASGEDIEYFYSDEDEDASECWVFLMPDEDAYIDVQATEKTTYVGRDFVGSYKGFPLTMGDNLISSQTQTAADLTLMYNTKFTVKTTDANAYDFDGQYTFTDATNSYVSQIETAYVDLWNIGNGMRGTWFTSGDTYLSVRDLSNDKYENARFYFLSNADCTADMACDPYGNHYLVGLNKAEGADYYHVVNIESKATPVTLRFLSGSSITAPCVADVQENGETVFRYSLESEGATPVFTYAGNERGTYTPASGSGSTLVLDGFGAAVYGDQEASYTVSSAVVRLTVGSETLVIVLDMDRLTYEIVDNAVWTGADSFTNTEATAYCDGEEAKSQYVTITMDRQVNGKEKEGYASIVAGLSDTKGTWHTVCSTGGAYVYSLYDRTLTITRAYVGKADGTAERVTLTFTVAEDGQSLICPDDFILRSTSGGDTRYIDLRGAVIKATEAETE